MGHNTPTMSTNAAESPVRIASVDVYRGAVMLLMLAEVLELGQMAKQFPASPTWQWLGYHQSHVAWRGCSIHDMIQPSFSFLVGVALPFSLASRVRRGESTRASLLHAGWRAFVLVLLGVWLRSLTSRQTNFTFEDTLSQIGLGYFPLFLIGLGAARWRWIVLALILVGSWGAFAAYPAPGSDFDYASVGVPSDWPHHATGFAAHWNKNSNLAAAFDRWFLHLFPSSSALPFHKGGYATLSFIPTLGTMLLGLIAGGWLRLDEVGTTGKIGRMLLAGAVGIALGLVLDWFGVCPIVKRIWTPAWVLFSGGICFVVLAVLYGVVDVLGSRGWTYPLVVIGRNAIAAYCLAHLIADFTLANFQKHLGAGIFEVAGTPYRTLLEGAALLTVYWLILFWMDRRRLYLKV